MEWNEEHKLDLLQTEMDRIASTNQRYIELEAERQELLEKLRTLLSRADFETVEKLVDVMELQSFLMIRSVLRVGIV